MNSAASPSRPAYPQPVANSVPPFPREAKPGQSIANFPTDPDGLSAAQKCLSGYRVSDTIPVSVRHGVVVLASAPGWGPLRGFGLSSGAEARENEKAFDRGNELMASGKLPKDEVFERLFDLHYGWVQRRFVSSGFTRSESEDLAQETFVRVYTGLDGFRGESSVGTWIKTIATRLALNRKRGSQAQKRRALELSLDHDDMSQDPLEAESDGPLDLVLVKEKLEFLRQAIADLPPQQRRCLILRIKGHKYKEIAILLGTTLEAVKSQLNQARKQLRPRLSEHFSDIDQDAGDDS